jgi:DNA-binding transcriptional LysR family regulator
MQLKALESDLKVTLYERHQGQIVLTDAGNLLLRYAETILDAEEEATKEIANLRGELLGRLRIGTNVTGGMYVVPSCIREYLKLHPEVEVALAIDTSPRIMDSVLQGTLDIGVIGGPVDRTRFDAVEVGIDELVLICSPDHLFTAGTSIRLQRLTEQSLIFPGIGSRSRWLLESMLRDRGMPIKAALTMSGTEEVKKAVEANLGVGFVSRYAVKRELRDGTLETLPIEDFRVQRTVDLFWRKGTNMPELARPFVEISREHLLREALECGLPVEG